MERDEELILIDKIRAGEEGLYKPLVDKYSSKILSIVKGVVRDRSDAEEVAQDVFVKAYFSLNKFRGDSSFSTWLYRIAYNMSISKVRKKNRYINVENINSFADSTGGDNDSNNALEKERRFKTIDALIERLEPLERFVLLSFYNHDKSIKEIAEITGMSEANVKVKLHRIKKKMITLVKEENKEVIYG